MNHTRTNHNATKLVLIGMANVGKSHWSKRLAHEMGHRRICCDDIITADLAPNLREAGLGTRLEDVAKWMGLPFEEGARRRQEIYLNFEHKSIWEYAIPALKGEGPVVIDCTGSAAHLTAKARRHLKRWGLVVYLEMSRGAREEMLQEFQEKPKPVYWGDHFKPATNEDGMATVRRCFPELCAFRHDRYTRIAHLTIPYEVHKAPDFTAGKLVHCVRRHLDG